MDHLQTLAMILSKLQAEELEPDDIAEKLRNLDRELRQVYESIRPDTIAKQASAPLHELLYQIYHKTLQRDFAGFEQLRIRIPDIHPMDDFYLDAEDKHELCDFLEEALCNVGKHAVEQPG
jgi:two-component sensor histidine kinase